MQYILGLQAGTDTVTQERRIVAGVAGTDGGTAAKHLAVGVAGSQLAAVEVFRPFPNQSVHVVDTPIVRFVFAYVLQTFPSAVGIPVKDGTVVIRFTRSVFLGG